MKKFIILAICCAWLTANATNQFDKIVSLGDSLSDNGNLYKYSVHMLPKSPPYYSGHFSNGPTWVEQLSSQLFKTVKKHLIDYSVGGAGAVLTLKENLPYTLKTEIASYFYFHPFSKNEKNLFVIWIGANNYTNVPSHPDKITTKVVTAIVKNVKNLINHHAKMILIMNLPDLGRSPEAKEKKQQQALSLLTEMHNEKLYRAYLALKDAHPEVTFAHYNIYEKFNDLLDNPQKYGITNVTEPCYLGGYRVNSLTQSTDNSLLKQWVESQYHDSSSQQLINTGFLNATIRESLRVAHESNWLQKNRGINVQALDCRGYLFWDHLHPTTSTHQILATDIATFLADAGFEATD